MVAEWSPAAAQCSEDRRRRRSLAMPAPAPLAAPLAAPLVALLAALALAEFPVVETAFKESRRADRSLGEVGLPPGCLYEGRWFPAGEVPTGEACLRCACRLGALACRRRACAALPDPPPHRCHVLHRRGSCCPELHCQDGVIMMEHGASARFENEDDINVPTSNAHACVEGGTVYAAGSAMRSTAACEQCFCLGGGRRCVRPQCLPPPPACQPRPAPGACCPQRYYCEHRTTKPPEEKHPHDCKVDGTWVTEGEKVVSKKASSNCTQCFCLRGAVQCQPLACAPPLLGCRPLLRAGECCAHQYQCDRSHKGSSTNHFVGGPSNTLSSGRTDQQAFHNPTSKKDATTKTTLASIYLIKNTRITSSINNLVSTTKVKRKTSDPPPLPETSSPLHQNTTETVPITSSNAEEKPITVTKLTSTTLAPTPTTELTTETTSTEQPEGSVRITVNGTINCTAELSSTSLPLNFTFNDTDKLEKITMESHPRIPLIDVSKLEDHTFSPNDIITDRNVQGDFDEMESFVINVTSSLRTNTSHSTTTEPPTTRLTTLVPKVSTAPDIAETLNTSKKTKGDYDYDYAEPTLPPSLPNLKIIPFVAADAVVENERPKETLTYPMHEREDKFPVYYPSADAKDTSLTRRDDVYHSTQYPVFITDKGEEQYPPLTQDVDLTSTGFSNAHSDSSTSRNEYTVSESLGSRISDQSKDVTPQPLASTTFKVEAPAVNLFSPPVETEGGFVPKGPSGLIEDEFYAVFPSTPSGPTVPHLTTSMQLDIAKGECISGDGRLIPEGETVSLACSECMCAWGELHCSPRACHSPAGCRRRPASSNSADLCCGELICDADKKPLNTKVKTEQEPTLYQIPKLKNETEILNNITEFKISIDSNKTIEPNFSKESNINASLHLIQNISKIANVNHAQPQTTTTERIKKLTTQLPSTTTPTTTKMPEQDDQPLEYEEEDDDGSFSFGNVLKLLLSGDSYESTTTTPKRLPTTSKLPPVKLTTTTRRPRPTIPPTPKPSVAPFIPMPLNPFIPPKIPQNPINRIDHLVLGEATAIKRTTLRPLATPPRPATSRPIQQTTQKVFTNPTEARRDDYTTESPRLPSGLSLGPGLLKLAGCNIYGQMYRVGRIIAELSTPCQECWCTEFGVQCKQLKC